MAELIYLDNASTSFPKPREVLDYMREFYSTHGVNPGRGGFKLALEAEEMVRETRRLLTQFFNGDDPNRLVFTYNASDSLNMIIQGVLEPGDHVITTNLEHNSVLRPIYFLEKKGIVEADYISFDEDGYVHQKDFEKTIKRNTRLIVINHGSNVIGTLQPIKEIGAICREKGVIFAIDASQTAGIVPIDVKAMNIDIVAFTGHKSLLAAAGIGGMYVRPGVNIKATRFGGTGIRSAGRLHPEEYPYRLECGTINVMGIAGLNAGQKWIARQGLQNIHQQELELWKILRDGLGEIEGVTLYCADSMENHIPVLTFNLDGYQAPDVGRILDVDYNIACRAGLHCAPLVHEQLQTNVNNGSIRFSIGPFNTGEHIYNAIKAVREIADKKGSL